MIDWLNSNAGVLTLIFTFVVAGATVFYAKLTHDLVDETRRLRKAQSEPHVSIRVEWSAAAFGFTDVIVENVGLGPAYGVSFAVERDLVLERGRKLSSIGFIKNGLSYLAPHQRVSSFLNSLFDMPDSQLEGQDRQQFSVRIKYRDAANVEHSELFTVDFSQFVGQMQIGTPPLQAIAKTLERIKDDVHAVTSGRSALEVVRLTPEDVAREAQNRKLRYMAQQLEPPALEPPVAPSADGSG